MVFYKCNGGVINVKYDMIMIDIYDTIWYILDFSSRLKICDTTDTCKINGAHCYTELSKNCNILGILGFCNASLFYIQYWKD